MTMIHVHRLILTLIACLSMPSCVARTSFDDVGREMVIILQNGHYAKLNFDDEMSERILEDYINFLDPQHLYFTESEVQEFRKRYSKELDNIIFRSSLMKPAKDIYTSFLKRVEKRVSFTMSLLDKKAFSFRSNEEILMDRKKAPWPKNDEDAEKLWKLHAEDSVLSEVLRRESIKLRASDLNKKAETYLDKEQDAYEKVKKRYKRILRTYRESDDEDIANYFLSTVASAYDPHSDYYSIRETEQFRSSIANSLVGIGALLSSEDDGATKIKGVVINGPADKQGELQLNDRIIGVDPLSNGEMLDIIYMPLNKVVSNIRGKENTNVTLKVEPASGAPGETKLIKIKRGRVELKDEMVSSEIYKLTPKSPNESALKLGWMKIPSFYKDFQEGKTSVAKDVKRILTRMNTEGVDGLVIDLQGNGGGSLDEVQKITGYFTGAGPVVQIKDSLGNRKVKKSYSKKAIFNKPLIVNVDKTSASASEILAAALQDYRRAVVVGDEFTFGKGTVQTPMEIQRFLKWYQDSSRAGTVKATIQKFYRVSGGSTQLKGVESDIIIPSLAEALEIGERYAKHALEYDQISQCNYKKGSLKKLFTKQLRSKSKLRVRKDKDFEYINEDVMRTKSRLHENKISLNIAIRRQEINESENRRKSRIREKTQRYATLAKDDTNNFQVYRLNLDDVNAETLPLVQKDVDTYMKRAKEALEDLDNTPDYPSDLTPTKRESLTILLDLIKLNNPVTETVSVQE